MPVLATVLKCFYGLLRSFAQRSIEALQEARDTRWYPMLTPEKKERKSAVIIIQALAKMESFILRAREKIICTIYTFSILNLA